MIRTVTSVVGGAAAEDAPAHLLQDSANAILRW
jgi:hypothetical protein